MKKYLGDFLRDVLEKEDLNNEARLYDLCYVLTMLHLHQIIDLKRHYELFEDLFDRVIQREKDSAWKFGRYNPPAEETGIKNVDRYIRNIVNVMIDMSVKKHQSTEEFLTWINDIPVLETVYESVVRFDDLYFDAVIAKNYLYYVDMDDYVGRELRKIHVSEIDRNMPTIVGDSVLSNVRNVFYIKERNCISCTFDDLNTYIRYYPETGYREAVYHKVLLGIDENGAEFCEDQSREDVENKKDRYKLRDKGRIGFFKITGGQVLVKADYVSEGTLVTGTDYIRLAMEGIPLDIGVVSFDFVKDCYIIRWPMQDDGGLEHIAEVEKEFNLSHCRYLIRYCDLKNGKNMEIREVSKFRD